MVPRGWKCASGPSTQHVRSLVPNTIKGIAFGPEASRIEYLDPLGNLPQRATMAACRTAPQNP